MPSARLKVRTALDRTKPDAVANQLTEPIDYDLAANTRVRTVGHTQSGAGRAARGWAHGKTYPTYPTDITRCADVRADFGVKRRDGLRSRWSRFCRA